MNETARRSAAARGFAGGFFGCFGVAAAVVLVVALFAGLGRLARVAAPAPRWERVCRAAIEASRGADARLDGAAYNPGSGVAVFADGPPAEIACPLATARHGAGFLTITARCDRAERSCFEIAGGMVGGEALDLDARR